MDADLAAAFRHLTRMSFNVFARRAFATVEGERTLYLNWLFHHLCQVLQDVADGLITRLIINVQPRSLKSFLSSSAFPAWSLGFNPGAEILCVSHSEPLARHFGGQTRAIMLADWYLHTFPNTRLVSRRARPTDLRTTKHGSRLATGINGAITGRGGDIIIVDDPIKAQDALSMAARERVLNFADTTLWSRLNDRRRGAIIVVMQRFHEDDLAGHLVRRGGWTVVSIPAIAIESSIYRLSRHPGHVHRRAINELLQSEREGPEQLEEQRRALGMYNFAAQYQQNPIPELGRIVLREWLRYVDHEPEQFDRTVISWDTASTTEERSDYSVGTVWGRLGTDFYLIEVIRRRFQVPDLQRQIVEVAQDFPDAVLLIENDGIGRGIAQNLINGRLTPQRPRLVSPGTDKAARFQRHLPLIEEGRLLLPREAGWLADYETELLGFPDSRYLDQIDSTSQALDYLTRDAARGQPITRRPTIRRPGALRRSVR